MDFKCLFNVSNIGYIKWYHRILLIFKPMLINIDLEEDYAYYTFYKELNNKFYIFKFYRIKA